MVGRTHPALTLSLPLSQVNRRMRRMRGCGSVAGLYPYPTSGDKILYFGLEKNKDNGNNNV